MIENKKLRYDDQYLNSERQENVLRNLGLTSSISSISGKADNSTVSALVDSLSNSIYELDVRVTNVENKSYNTEINGENGLSAKINSQTSAWDIGLLNDYKTAIEDVSGKQDALSETQLSNIDNAITSLDGYATETWVEQKGYLTEHQDISNKLDTSSFSNVSGTFLQEGDVVSKLSNDRYVRYDTDNQGLVEQEKYNARGNIDALAISAFSSVSGTFLTEHQSLDGYVTSATATAKDVNYVLRNGEWYEFVGGDISGTDVHVLSGKGIDVHQENIEEEGVVIKAFTVSVNDDLYNSISASEKVTSDIGNSIFTKSSTITSANDDYHLNYIPMKIEEAGTEPTTAWSNDGILHFVLSGN